MPLPVRAESRLPNRSPSAHLHQEADTTRVTAIVQPPDQAAPNPVLGSGASRSVQLGLKLVF
ncbi:MAG: hypothetical protein JWQ49_5209 [Edaphobacter sp.]|nr:hypothetical protein [Edaphobacter sp.]